MDVRSLQDAMDITHNWRRNSTLSGFGKESEPLWLLLNVWRSVGKALLGGGQLRFARTRCAFWR